MVKAILASAFTGFAGFIFGISYTVAAAESSTLVKIVAIIKGVLTL